MITFKTCMHSTLALLLLIPFCMGQAQTRNTVSQTPKFTINTNLLYDATASMNLGVEAKLGNRVTLKLPVTYNPWEHPYPFGYPWKDQGEDNKKFKFVMAQPELRWWLCEPFYGSFFGLHAHGALFNVGGVGTNWMKDYRFEGYLYGAGLSYGYQFYLAPRWNLELSIGGGYVFLNYDRYGKCQTCGDPEKPNQKEHHLWPTQAGVTLIYIIK